MYLWKGQWAYWKMNKCKRFSCLLVFSGTLLLYLSLPIWSSYHKTTRKCKIAGIKFEVGREIFMHMKQSQVVAQARGAPTRSIPSTSKGSLQKQFIHLGRHREHHEPWDLERSWFWLPTCLKWRWEIHIWVNTLPMKK